MPGIVSGVGNLAGAVVKAPFQIVSATGKAVLGSKKNPKKGRRVHKRNSRKTRVVRRRRSSSSRSGRRTGRRSSRRRGSK